MEELNCKTEGLAPLGQASKYLFNEGIIKKLSEKFKKTPAQIILRWHIQSGFITIPKSVNPQRIKENFEIFDFELAEDEKKSIDELDGKRGRVQYNSLIMYFGLWLLPVPKD